MLRIHKPIIASVIMLIPAVYLLSVFGHLGWVSFGWLTAASTVFLYYGLGKKAGAYGVIAFVAVVALCIGKELLDAKEAKSPNNQYAQYFKNLREGNSKTVNIFAPEAAGQSVIWNAVMRIASAHAKNLQIAADSAVAKEEGNDSFDTTVENTDAFKIATKAKKNADDYKKILRAADIPIPGETVSKSSTSPQASIRDVDLSDNDPMAIPVPANSMLTMWVDSAYYSLDNSLNCSISKSKGIWVSADGIEASPVFAKFRRMDEYPAPNLPLYSLMYSDGGWQPFRQNGRPRVINDSLKTKKFYVALNCVPNGYKCHQGVCRIKTEIRSLASFASN